MIVIRMTNKNEVPGIYSIERTYDVYDEERNEELIRTFTLAFGPHEQIKLRDNPFKTLRFEKAVGQWNITNLCFSNFFLYDEAVIVQKELTEILEIIDYFRENKDLLEL